MPQADQVERGGRPSPQPILEGIRVLDLATFVAAPFCGTILGDFGAEVIKIEQPGGGDSLRRFGTPTECGDTLVWLSESRNKKSVTLDIRSPEGSDMLRRLASQADVILENFRPGTMEKWGLGYERLSAENPGLVMLRVSAYGQNGPKRHEPGFARIAHAFSGLTFLAGEAGRVPVVPGSTSLADYISGMWGAVGVLLALRGREATGKGQVVDIGLYESVFRLLDEIAPAYAKFGVVRQRMGADTVNVAPHSHYQTSSGDWVAIACTNDKMFQRLAALMERADLASSPDYATSQARAGRRTEVNALVAAWVGSMDLPTLLSRCQAGGVPCGAVYSIEDIFKDEQFKARENLLEVQDARVGELTIPAAMPRLSDTPAAFRHTGPALGEHTDDVLTELLGLSPQTLSDLRERCVI
ncbi:MAG: CoA transferase [Acetobacteraceae bacterium]